MKRWAAIVALVVAVGGLVAGGEPPAALRQGLFGISGIMPDLTYLDELPLDVATSGFWIGASEGFLGGDKEALHTRQMKAFVDRGITPVATFYLGAGGADTARYAEEIVRHYTSGQGAIDVGAPVVYWELGDEENGGWGTSCDPEEYARRVAVIAPAIRRGCPDCRIVMGGLLDGPNMGEWALAPYLEAFLDAGGGEWIDVYAFHYYGLALPHPAWPGAELYDTAIDHTAAMRRILAAHGLADRPIWVTETSTFSGRVGEVEQTESDQAADLVKRYLLLWSLGVETVQWCYLTEPQYEGTGLGFFDQSGLVYDGEGPYDRGAGTAKRAYSAYVHMVRRLRDATLLEREASEGVTLVRLDVGGEAVSVLWQDPWVRQGAVWVIPDGAVTVEDLCGAPLGGFEEAFRVDLAIEPVYLLGPVRGVSTAAPALQSPASL